VGRPKHPIPAPQPPKRVWVTQVYVANHLGVTTRTVREWTADGRLTGYRLNSKFVRYDLNEVDAAMQPFGGSVSA
jgi:excisionase family DNA binding protein